jgi:hypothetical protein
MGNLAVLEQPCQQRQGLLRQHGVHETLLSLDRFNRAATGLCFIVKGRIDDFLGKLGHPKAVLLVENLVHTLTFKRPISGLSLTFPVGTRRLFGCSLISLPVFPSSISATLIPMGCESLSIFVPFAPISIGPSPISGVNILRNAAGDSLGRRNYTWTMCRHSLGNWHALGSGSSKRRLLSMSAFAALWKPRCARVH